MKIPPVGFAANSGELGEKRAINSELWHACAGPLVALPPVGSLVVYFPQGHSEQVAASMQKETDGIPSYPNLPSKLICMLRNVTLHADAETDEVYAQMTLQPVNKYDEEALLVSDIGLKYSRQPAEFFCKTLTASDTSTHGGFSVPRRAAEKIFPPLDFSMQPPAQELAARDLHDQTWSFRHIFRGQPKRHLLTTGWSVFVSNKRLVAGDAVLFIRDEKSQFLLGIRRAIRQQPALSSSVISSDSMHIGILAAAAHAAANNTPFTVFFNPRASPSEFVVPLSKYNKATYSQVSAGMRFRMMFETEESGVRRYMGTVTGVTDLDPVRWKNSQWRNLQVGWDESTAGARPSRVSAWDIEPVVTPFYLCPPPLFRPNFPKLPAFADGDMDIENILKGDMPMPWLADEFGLKDASSSIFPGLSLVQWMSMRQNQNQNQNRPVSAQSGMLPNLTPPSAAPNLHSTKVNHLNQQAGQLQQPTSIQQPLQHQQLQPQPQPQLRHQQLQQPQLLPPLTTRNQNLQQPAMYSPLQQNKILAGHAETLQNDPTTSKTAVSVASLAQNLARQHHIEQHPSILQRSQQQQQQIELQQIRAQQNLSDQHVHLLQKLQHQHQHQHQLLSSPNPVLDPQFLPSQQLHQNPSQYSQHFSDPQQVSGTWFSASTSEQSPQFPFNNLQSQSMSPHIARPQPSVSISEDVLSCSMTPKSSSQVAQSNLLNRNQTGQSSSQNDATVVNHYTNLVQEARDNKIDIQMKHEMVDSKIPDHPKYKGLDHLSASSSVTSYCLDAGGSGAQQTFPLTGLDADFQSSSLSFTATTADGLAPDLLLSKGFDPGKDVQILLSNYDSPRDINPADFSDRINPTTMEGPTMPFRTGCSSEVAINDTSALNGGLWTNHTPRMRTYAKVQKRGSVGRTIDVTRYLGYDELKQDLGRMFGIEGLIDDPQRTEWKLVYVDHENDILLVGDDPWEEFVSCVRSIKILSTAEVQQMSLDGALDQLPMRNQNCSRADSGNEWRG